MKLGKVILVGAGPGAADLITVRGKRAIASADIILYDALSGEDLLEYARDTADLIYVGKRCGRHSLSQVDINALLYQCAKRAGIIVRLKGGDPFVFGRGHEELTYLSSKGIDVEVIPGISSTTSLSLLQHVPLTRRGLSESFWVLTGTTKNHQLSDDIRTAVKTSATLVVLMGMRKLEEIAQLLITEQRSNVPIMIIQNGSRPDEKLVLGRATDIVEKVKIARITSPGIIVIGEVVSLHPQLVKAEIAQSVLS